MFFVEENNQKMKIVQCGKERCMGKRSLARPKSESKIVILFSLGNCIRSI